MIDDAMWRAVRDRDSGATFVFGVKTTGICCRVGCPSRLPNPANVVAFRGFAEAKVAGFRACRRCRPDTTGPNEAQRTLVLAACARIETEEEEPGLAALAAAAGMSPWHFQRVFKRITSVTPKQYAKANRRRRFERALNGSKTVTEAIYEAGYNAGSRAYAEAAPGLSPSDRRKRGEGAVITYALEACPLGWVLAAATPRGLCAVALADTPEALRQDLTRRFSKAVLKEGEVAEMPAVLAATERPGMGLDLPLDVAGTAFQARVWAALKAIPPGQTVTYGELAAWIGRPGAARAVAGACAANPVALAVPCHRVVGGDGGLGGYRWGTARKRRLLEAEAAS